MTVPASVPRAATLSVAFRTMPAAFAVIVAVCEDATIVVVTGNVADVAPCTMLTLAGTVAAPLSLERPTANPPAPAALVSVTVPVEGEPPLTEVGSRTSEESAGPGGTNTSADVWVTPPAVAEMSTEVVEATAVVTIVKLACNAPALTETLDGTDAADMLELASVTGSPPAEAGADSVTIPDEGVPPSTTPGERTRLVTETGPTERIAVRLTLPCVAVSVAVDCVATLDAETVNVAEVASAGTVTEAGTVATEVSELESERVLSERPSR